MSPTILPYREMLPSVAEDAFVAENAVIIGDVVIGSGSNIWYNCVLRGDVHEIRVGDGVNIQDGTIVHVATDAFGTYIGDNVSIGHMALIHACTLEPGAFVGMKACVMDGSVVESGAMVAAGALVTPGKRIPSGQIWGGSPAKHIRDLTEKDRRFFDWTAPHYVKLGAEYRKRQKRSGGS